MTTFLIVGGPRSGQNVDVPWGTLTDPVMMPDEPLGGPSVPDPDLDGVPIPITRYRRVKYAPMAGRIVRCLVPEYVRDQDLHLHLTAIVRPEALEAMEP